MKRKNQLEAEISQDVLELKRQWTLSDGHEPPPCLWITCSDLVPLANLVDYQAGFLHATGMLCR